MHDKDKEAQKSVIYAYSIEDKMRETFSVFKFFLTIFTLWNNNFFHIKLLGTCFIGIIME